MRAALCHNVPIMKLRYALFSLMTVIGLAVAAVSVKASNVSCPLHSHSAAGSFAPIPQSPATVEQELANCPFLAEVKRWQEWRQRHPNAHSRFPKLNIEANAAKVQAVNLGALAFSPTPDDEPEPDPSSEGCGCGWWTALVGGCGLLHMLYGT